jgi:hypothetical protein
MEYIVVLVTSYFRDLASASKAHWQVGAEAPALEQEPKLLLGAGGTEIRCTAPRLLWHIKAACGARRASVCPLYFEFEMFHPNQFNNNVSFYPVPQPVLPRGFPQSIPQACARVEVTKRVTTERKWSCPPLRQLVASYITAGACLTTPSSACSHVAYPRRPRKFGLASEGTWYVRTASSGVVSSPVAAPAAPPVPCLPPPRACESQRTTKQGDEEAGPG